MPPARARRETRPSAPAPAARRCSDRASARARAAPFRALPCRCPSAPPSAPRPSGDPRPCPSRPGAASWLPPCSAMFDMDVRLDVRLDIRLDVRLDVRRWRPSHAMPPQRRPGPRPGCAPWSAPCSVALRRRPRHCADGGPSRRSARGSAYGSVRRWRRRRRWASATASVRLGAGAGRLCDRCGRRWRPRAAAIVHGWSDASGITAHANSAVAAAVRSRGHARARHARIEDRHQPAFELRSVRHRQGRAGQHRREAPRSHHARDLEQLVRVVGSARAGRQHQIVARALALGAHVPRGDPRQRVEPVQRARDLREQVREAVAALHVRQLVEQDDAQPFGRPRVGVGRHQDRGAQDAPRHRHRGAPAAQEHDARRDAQLRRERTRERQPRRVRHALGAARHPLHAEKPEGQTPENRGGAKHPDQDSYQLPVAGCQLPAARFQLLASGFDRRALATPRAGSRSRSGRAAKLRAGAGSRTLGAGSSAAGNWQLEAGQL